MGANLQPPFASPDELVVNERILKQCMHGRYRARPDGLGFFTVCPDCHACGYFDEPQTKNQIRDFWSRKQLRPAWNPINAGQVERALEAAGWTVTYYVRHRLICSCRLTKLGRRYESDLCATPEAALVQVAAQVARRGLHD